MKYTLIWIDSGAVLDSSIVCDSIQEAIEAKKRFQKTVRRNTAPAACVTMWAVEYDADRPIVNDRNRIISSGLMHFVISGLPKLTALKTRLRLEMSRSKNVKMYEYVQRIID